MRKDDKIRLRHMLDAAREALEFTQGRTLSDLKSDRMLALSLVKEIEIVGEAANQISQTTREEMPGIPGTLPLIQDCTNPHILWFPKISPKEENCHLHTLAIYEKALKQNAFHRGVINSHSRLMKRDEMQGLLVFLPRGSTFCTPSGKKTSVTPQIALFNSLDYIPYSARCINSICIL